MNKEYKKEYFKKHKFENKLSPTKKFIYNILKNSPYPSTYYNELIRIINSLPKNARVLDVAIADGTFTNFIHSIRQDLDFYAIDISDVSKIIPKYVKFKKANVNSFKFNFKFDLIICNHLIEHLKVSEVPNALKNINLNLSSEGFFWFTVPSFDSKFYNDPTHIRPYNKVAMKRLLEMSKFRKIEVHENSYFRFPFNYFKSNNIKISYGFAKR